MNTDYFIIYPRDHQFAVQSLSGRIIKYFDNCTYSDCQMWLENFLHGKTSVQLDLFL